jgi:hypothetical protein
MFASNTASTTVTANYPATVTAGDFLVMFLYVDHALSVTTPAGWTLQFSDSTSAVGGTGQIYTYTKVAVGTEGGGTFSITHASSGTTGRFGQIVSFGGFTGAPAIEAGVFTTGASSPTAALPTVTSTGVDRLDIAQIFTFGTATVISTSATGETGGDWVFAQATSATSGGSTAFCTQTANMPAAGTISGGTVAQGVATVYAVRAFSLFSVKVFMVAAGNDGNFGALVDGVDQTAASRTDGWTVAKIAAANMAEFDAGTEQASGAFTTAAKPASFLTGTTANAFKTPAALTGTFAALSWTFTFAVRATVASSQAGRMRLRVFAATDAAGTIGVRELTSATQVGITSAALSTTADVTSAVTWNPGTTITMNAEYLFFVIAWEITTASGSNSGDVLIRTGQAAGGSFLVTPDFTATTGATTNPRITVVNRAPLTRKTVW